MWNPLSWVMEAAAIMAITLPNTGGKSRDWQDFVGIIAVLSINSILSIWEECDPDRVAAELMDCQVPKARVLRDGIWSEQDATLLVLGDIVRIKLGDIIPVDARILDGDSLKIDEFALMRESPTLTKGCGDCVYSGSTCKQGECEAVVIATGAHSLFAKAVAEPTNQVCHFQEVLRVIGNFCICSIAVGMFVEIIVMYIIQHRQYRSGIDNLIVLLIGGVPFTMPTVLSSTMAFGLKRLAQKGALTKRITVIEQMASMDILCVDITGSGTLTLNTIDENLIETFAEGVEADTVVLMAAQASRTENQDPIGAAIIGMLFDPKEARAGIQEFDFLHFDPTDKSTMLICIDKKAGIKIAVADATEAARSASNIVLTEPCIRAIISVVLTSRAIIQTMKNYTIYAVSNTICIVLGFMLLALLWKFDFPPFMVLIFVILYECMLLYKTFSCH